MLSVVVLCAVISVLSVGMYQAHEIADGGYGFFQALDRPEPLDIVTLSGNAHPIAAIYSVMRENREQIMSLHCEICGTTTIGDDLGECLRNHLRGRGILAFSEDGYGGFGAILTEG
jgi:hypothetical protein